MDDLTSLRKYDNLVEKIRHITIEIYFCLHNVVTNLAMHFGWRSKERTRKVGEGLGENDPIFWIAEHKVGENNTKGVECCEAFSTCTLSKYPHWKVVFLRCEWSNSSEIVKKLSWWKSSKKMQKREMWKLNLFLQKKPSIQLLSASFCMLAHKARDLFIGKHGVKKP